MISSLDYERVRDVFLAACRLPSAERVRFLDGSDLTPPLRAQVEALLESDDALDTIDSLDSDASLAIGVAPVAAIATPLPTRVSPDSGDRWFGPYRLVERIGEGGMGIVYRAEQRSPVERIVALKVLKPGLHSEQIARRFAGERQVLASMNHPNIANIFDAGVTDSGQPYFAMEYVAGSPITEYADQQRWTLRERLDVFLRVCDAIQHAHQKGIIHRDLKPSNILVTNRDGVPTPKVIDFGVAKALSGERGHLSEDGEPTNTILTLEGMMIGTPEYMSPEQAIGARDDVDTRSDVYSLGIVLYELLTGLLPFDSRELRQGSYAEIQARILGRVPQRPSTRLRAVGNRATELAARRQIDARTFERRLLGDLDWITMRAVDKARVRRYESPARLADDIIRYLHDEPVSAGPPSFGYRAIKFVKRNRGAVSITGALTVAAWVGVGTQFGGPTVAAVTVMALLLGAFAVNSALLRRTRLAQRAAIEQQKLVDQQRQAAESHRQIAASHLADVLRLSDMHRLSELEERAQHLWPAHPDRIADLEAWLADAEQLDQRLPLHRQALEQLRAQALSYHRADRERDYEDHPDRAELEQRRTKHESFAAELASLRARTEPTEADRRRRNALERETKKAAEHIAQLEDRVRRRRTWQFDTTERQWWHDRLAELVERLDTFLGSHPTRGYVQSVRTRLASARSITERSLTSDLARDAWRAALADIASLDVYHGLELGQQLGLVPLGRNETTGLWEFWHVESGERPERNDDHTVSRWRLAEETGVVLVLLPAGRFEMGAQSQNAELPGFDPHAHTNESPVQEVELDAFFISCFPMTQGQWLRIAGENPSVYACDRNYGGKQHDLRHPVENISWTNCVDALARVQLELPTEAQWEYAARAGTATPWWTGSDPKSLSGAANLADRFARQHGGITGWAFEDWLDDGYVVHSPCGSYRANAFGLHDVHGNVFEWCRDAYGEYDEHTRRSGDGELLASDPRSRMFRGGSYAHDAVIARSSHRVLNSPGYTGSTVGVRPIFRTRTAGMEPV